MYDTPSFFRCESTEAFYIYYVVQYVLYLHFCWDVDHFTFTMLCSMYDTPSFFRCESTEAFYIYYVVQYVPYIFAEM